MKYTKICKYCGSEFVTNKPRAEFCTHKCNALYHDNINRLEKSKHLIETGIENIDYVIDKWNGLATPRIYGKWMKNLHPGKTTEDYKAEFPDAPLCCAKDKTATSKNSGQFMKTEKYRKLYSEYMSGDKNPNSKVNTTEEERRQRSPFSKDFYTLRNICDSARLDFIKNVRERVVCNTQLEYYINKGYSAVEAKEKLSKRQKTNTIENYIKKYGADLGPIKFNERNANWSVCMEKKYQNGDYSKMPKHLGIATSKKEKEMISFILDECKLDPDKCYFAGSTLNQLSIHSDELHRNFFYDFAYENKIIEFNGDFWYANPKRFDDNFTNPFNNLSANEIHERNKTKNAIAENAGYKILTIWESDYDNDLVNIISRCKDFILS